MLLPHDRLKVFVDETPSQGSPKYFQIQRKGPVLDVIEIIIQTFIDRSILPQPMNLGPPCDPGFYLVTQHVLRNFLPEIADKLWPFGTRTNQAHFPFQHIDQLGKFVDTVLSQESSDFCYPFIIRFAHNRPSLSLCIRNHSPEFKYGELVTV
jgi:hypothetical protein